MNISQWVRQLDFSYVISLGISALAAILCICVHESAHGLAALALGDPTAKQQGRISLNPLRHVDLVGLVMLAVAHVGWAKPVRIDPRYFKNPKAGMALTALAGPVSNFLLAFLTGFVAALCYFGSELHSGSKLLYYLFEFFYTTTIISCGLGVFNLIPISPLDGSKVLYAFLPERAYFTLMRYERYGMFLLIALVMFGALNGILGPAVEAVSGFVMRLVVPLAAAILRV
ncbi:MAG: site-2 protease family protein [Ruminococcaceae bacterium]|jgi:Zn-dependent protease|nr:site-2 protease family protein [Oscillospiraceae bacterium]